MIVAGGTYHERVLTSSNHDEDFGGSGFRAAQALAARHVTLQTAVEPSLAALLPAAATAAGITANSIGRDKGVGFTYYAQFAEPLIRGADANLTTAQHIEGDHVVAFGLIERGTRTFDVESLVYDPQSVSDPTGQALTDAKHRRLSLCANTAEIRALGGQLDIEDAANNAAERLDADVVVTKAGARGCLVSEPASGRQTWVGAVPTTTVRKLGSGDVFTAAFASAWTLGADPIEAARAASHAVAWWCEHPTNTLPETVLNGEALGNVELGNAGTKPKIYLAGPFFTPAERWLVDRCRDFLHQAGADVFSPVHEIGMGGPEVARLDLAGLRDANAVFAILDGWDPGTLFETGWANHAGIPVVGVGANLDHVGVTMLAGTGAELHTDMTTALYRAIWVGLGVEPRGYGAVN